MLALGAHPFISIRKNGRQGGQLLINPTHLLRQLACISSYKELAYYR